MEKHKNIYFAIIFKFQVHMDKSICVRWTLLFLVPIVLGLLSNGNTPALRITKCSADFLRFLKMKF